MTISYLLGEKKQDISDLRRKPGEGSENLM